MKEWLKALLSQTVFSVWWILSGFSTLCTFFFHGWASEARIVLTVSALLGFGWGNFKVFQGQERRIASIRKASVSPEPRTAQLRILKETGSQYYLHPNSLNGDFTGIFLDFRLMIENLGQRNSTVNKFDVEIAELKKVSTDLKPLDRSIFIQTRRSNQQLSADRALNKAGIVEIPAEKATVYGTLLLFVPANREDFSKANLQMNFESQSYPPLRCNLVLTDTIGSRATAEFELREG